MLGLKTDYFKYNDVISTGSIEANEKRKGENLKTVKKNEDFMCIGVTTFLFLFAEVVIVFCAIESARLLVTL